MRKPQPQPQPESERNVPSVSYSVEDAAIALGIGRTFCFHLIKVGKLRAFKLGRRTLVSVREVEAFTERQGMDAA